MNSKFAIQERVQIIGEASNHEERLYNILKLYMELFPVSNAYLFRYSPLGYLAEGIISLSSSGLAPIDKALNGDIRPFEIVHAAIREKKAKFFTGKDFFTNRPSGSANFLSKINSIVVVPICLGTYVIGYIATTKLPEGADFDEKLLSSLTLYGQLVGKLILTDQSNEANSLLSNRELEVMIGIAQGDSTKEMAVSMNISDLTVKQYVKSALKKLSAQNRSHAVAELFRKGILF